MNKHVGKPVFNEITVRLVREPNMPVQYEVRYGNASILKQISVPSDDDIKQALHRFRQDSNTTEPTESARVRQLSDKKYRHGQFRESDDEPPRAA